MHTDTQVITTTVTEQLSLLATATIYFPEEGVLVPHTLPWSPLPPLVISHGAPAWLAQLLLSPSS